MHETEHLSVGGILQDGLQTGLIIMHVPLYVSALNVKHVNQHLHIPEHVVSLTGEVVLHERFLARGGEVWRGWSEEIRMCKRYNGAPHKDHP